MNGFEVDLDSLRRGDQDLQAVLRQTVSELERFEAELAAQGEPWGSDELGVMIGEVYKGAYAMAMNCLYSNLDTMDAYGERLTIAADAYQGADDLAAQRLETVRQAAAGVESPR